MNGKRFGIVIVGAYFVCNTLDYGAYFIPFPFIINNNKINADCVLFKLKSIENKSELIKSDDGV